MNRTTRFLWIAPCLAVFVTLSPCHLVTLSSAKAQDRRQDAVKTAPEPAPQQPPRDNWLKVTTPGVAALARPDSFLQYGPPQAGVCCPGCKSGCLLRRIVAWATYCPKYRVCSCCQSCNSCQYKGVWSLYPLFLQPPCVCGSGLQATFGNDCYRGIKDCAACGH